ncbi:MAG: topoisomerase C-terminal repeat-containing protein [Agathobacter sp.]|nr:topoisomerase C-terminal repeat-containing protein [Agathobacter sp.]
MGKSLIITEKPSVAVEFAKVLQVSGRKDGYIENQNYVITWCVGHLVGLVYPESYDEKYKKWKLEDLPFLPKDYKYDVIKEVKNQYDIVHNMLMREDIDRVYWAGDAGKEGQTIEENIRNYGGVREGMEELRVWIDSQTEEEILRGIREAKPMSDYANLGNSGIMRTIEDYAMGINFSRVMSIKYGQLLNDAAGTKSYTAIAVGRVMTCVLGMVVIREREIRNFKETPFYRVVGNFTDAGIEGEWKAVEGSKYFESPLLYKENGFKEEKDANALIDLCNGKEAKVKALEKSTSKKRAPFLFNLAELQAECAKRFKISPDETLQIAQDLYEKKLTTYPRTDARVLSTAVAKEIYKNISKLKNYETVAPYVEEILKTKTYTWIAKTAYVDDSKVTDHYAIIPTGQLTELNKLDSLQLAVFELICRRFLSIFYPAAEYENVKLTVGVEKEEFFASAKVLKAPGYLEVAGIPKKRGSNNEENADEGGENPDGNPFVDANGDAKTDPQVLLKLAETLHVGDVIPVNGYGIRYGKTSPPKRYTSGSMVLAMENAGQLIEDEELREQIKGSGIGTSATRAEIIKKLIRIGYLNLNKKTQVLTPENLGEMIYEVVNLTVPALLNPKMSASWEKGLEGITQGTVDFWDYRNKLEDFIRRETLKMIDQNLRHELADRISEFAGKNAKGLGARKKIGVKCPLCDGELVTTPFGYGCTKYKADKTGCNFNIGEICNITPTEEQVKMLFEQGHTDTIRGFKSKAGKKFDAALKLEKTEDGKVNIIFDFAEVEPEVLPDVTCPSCGGQMVKKSFGYGCINYNAEDENSCRFAIGTIAGKTLSAANVKQLLTEGKTETLRGFKSKAGKKFDACLILEKDENGKPVVNFDFEHVEAKKIKDVSCPLCGGDIVATPFGFGCANYDKEKEDSCRFSIGKMAEKSLTEANVKELLTNGITGTIRGFKSKTGKKFDARVALSKDETGKVTGLKFDFNDLEPVKVKDVLCPLCKGDIIVTPFGYGCSNYKKEDPEHSCRFMIGKIASVKLKEAHVKQLLTVGKTDVIEGFVARTGMKFDAPLKLTEDGQVTFDFPEKPKPVESNVDCPKCQKKMQKGQWQYECECGFKLWHTVAKVPLTEETIIELLTTGKTKKKIVGFTSKSGNVFDACLKYEDDTIKFDFDNPGEDDDKKDNQLDLSNPDAMLVELPPIPDEESVEESNEESQS